MIFSLKNKLNKKKDILKKYTGKGGPSPTAFKQASTPIDLLKIQGSPPTADGVPKTKNNYLGNKLTK
jgi:hypothetical protein